jgi:glycosyltransferase involved in cell wall biosynthesis
MGTAGVRLYTAHEQWLVCPMHVLWKYNRRVCERPTCWRCGVAFKRPPQPWRSTGLLERSLGKLDALIVPSATTGRLHESLAGTVRIEHIPHFVADPPARAEPTRAATVDRPGAADPYFLYAGRLESIKGVVGLVEAFGAHPRRERLLIAGSGTQAERVREAADGVPGVSLLGWVEGTELEDLYRGALALVVPTLGHESLPLVVLEALARGTPVVARRFGVLEELAGETDAVLSYGSTEELHRALDRLAADPALRAELGERGTQAFADRWTPERHLARYLGLIAELAEAHA